MGTRPSKCVYGEGTFRDHLGLLPGGQEWIGAVREEWEFDNKILAGVSGLRNLLPALAQCEVLVGVWHPAMCRRHRFYRFTQFALVDDPPYLPLCTKFKLELESLPLRYPRLKTIYIIDPNLKPRPKESAIGKPRPLQWYSEGEGQRSI